MIEFWEYGSRDGKWRPLGATARRGNPEIGALVAVNHVVYRVREIRPKPRVDWDADAIAYVERHGPTAGPVNVICRPAHITGDDPKLRSKDRHFRAHGKLTWWWTYPNEHYSVCASCGEPMPCRERLAIEEAERAAKFAARYEVPGVCPACCSPVTQRQGARTFAENLCVPLGPPVTFHASKRDCFNDLLRYEERWVAADPDNRRPRYHCDGILTAHDPDNYECAQGIDCPGPQASHKALRGCQCHPHNGPWLRVNKRAQNLALTAESPQHPAEGGETR